MTPFEFFNQYSFFMPWVLALLALAGVLASRRARKGWLLILAGVVGLGAAAVIVRAPRQTTVDVSSVDAIRAAIASNGRPTLVHFHSHY
jgi:hypothetical protein